MAQASLLSVKDLSVVYRSKGPKIVALDSVTIDIKKKEFVAVVGESGCGKSTLALSIIGLLPSQLSEVTGGTIVYKSTDLVGMSEEERRSFRGTEIAMVFQEPLTSLNPVYKVGDQIGEAILVRQGRSDGKNGSSTFQNVYNAKSARVSTTRVPFRRRVKVLLRDEIIAALKLVRIGDPEQVIDRYPFELSGGMRQRVMIAMALSEKPALLIADEPTTALDVTTQAQVLRLMRDLMDELETSVLLISHDLAVASQVADRVVVMYAGDVVEDASVYDLFEKPLHPYTQGLLLCIPSGSKDEVELKPIPGSVPTGGGTIVGCKYANRCPHVMSICREKKPKLIEKENGHKVSCYLYDERR